MLIDDKIERTIVDARVKRGSGYFIGLMGRSSFVRAKITWKHGGDFYRIAALINENGLMTVVNIIATFPVRCVKMKPSGE